MTKDAVFAILKKDGGYVSGEKISVQLGISRAAVNVAVKSLRNDGCEIESVTNKGYHLVSAPDRLTAGDLMVYLSDERMKRVLCIDTVDSTNKMLKNMANNNACDGQVVIANEQTSGRGRLGKSFASPSGKGIYMSILMRPNCTPQESVTLTAWTAVAVSNAIEKVIGTRPGIKWVNDIVINKKKICGILTEMSVESEGQVQYIVVGIGINVNENIGDFPKEIQNIASSLFEETGQKFLRAYLASEIVKEMDIISSTWPSNKEKYLAQYKECSVTINKEIKIISPTGEKLARAVSINDDFSLEVEYGDGTHGSVTSGEVSVRGIYDYI